VWFGVKVGLTALAALCTAQSAQAYEQLHEFCKWIGREDWLTSTDTNEQKATMATVAIPLAILVLVVSLLQERAATRDSVRTERDSLYFVNELRKGVGPKLKEILSAGDTRLRNERLDEYIHVLLVAAYDRWGEGDLRLGYYSVRKDRGKYFLDKVQTYPLELEGVQATQLPSLPAKPKVDVKPRWRPWKPRKPEYKDCLKSLMIVPVSSPLETMVVPSAVILVDSSDARRFEGKPNTVSAHVLADMMAVGKLAATGRPQVVR
jgi:hypothetical protein